MKLNKFKDKLFDILNETDELPVKDIIFNDKEDSITILLSDGSAFRVHSEEYKK